MARYINPCFVLVEGYYMLKLGDYYLSPTSLRALAMELDFENSRLSEEKSNDTKL